jgi:sorting nexin-25
LEELFSDTDFKGLDLNGKDSIAEPFYYLIEELFEIRGMKKIFRKSLILFVQLTYGATINRKIRETIYWILNEEVVSLIIKQIKDSIWKVNNLTGELELIKHDIHHRTNEEKAQTKNQAKQKLIENIPG